MKATVLRRSVKKPVVSAKDGRSLQRMANAMLMKCRKEGIPLPPEYILIRRQAEEALGMWAFQKQEIERYGKLQPTLPTSKRVFYRVIRDHSGNETLVLGQGGNTGYMPKVCGNCSNLPAGSSDCLHFGCYSGADDEDEA